MIYGCMAVSVRELCTAVCEWACCYKFNVINVAGSYFEISSFSVSYYKCFIVK